MPHPLDSFFAPASIALIGASRDHEKIPGRLLSMLRKNEYPGKIYPVNPNYADIDGLACHKSIGEIGAPIDLAVIIIPARAVLPALEQCAAAGVRNAVIISSGFAEEGGDSAAMQDAIGALARRTGMRISGPNAEGFFSQVQRVAATFSPAVDVKPEVVPLVATTKRIGIVAQSGGIGFAYYHRARALGVAVSYVVSSGNESDLGAGEFLDYMVRDASTDVILLFIEGIRDVDKFLAAARRAAEVKKPIIVTKVGRSGAGQRAAASHTASMAGWSAAYDAVFAKYGLIVSNDLDEALTIAAMLASNPLPRGDRVAVVTVSGGAGIWGADAVALQGLRVPELSEPIQAGIKALMPSYGTARNPIDVTAQGVTSGGLQKSVDLLTVSDEVDAILVVLSLSSEVRKPFKDEELGPVLSAQHKPVVFYSYTVPSDFARRELAKSGVVVLSGLTYVGTAMRQLVDYARFNLPKTADATRLPPRDLSAHLKAPVLSEADSKALLRAAGIALPDEVLVRDKSEIDQAVGRVGLPLAMKIQSRDIAHKSEIGGVRLNIATKGEAFLAFEALFDAARKHRPEADIQGVLVGPMAKRGVEIIVGTMLDETFGLLVMVGLGGITTELFRDVVYRPAPVSAEEAGAMLASLKAAPLLNGFRGAAKADVAALSQLIADISVLAARHAKEIAEIELNPVLVHAEGQGVTIVDTLVVGSVEPSPLVGEGGSPP
ncbi:acetate--CoA ligase family protein [Bradyrhizobium diazoefficiens]|uniref:acetate--CoA ligase family protein n=1 Tax=Bradyrhizobium centrosematis TaxID=1300039 RepID=UPI001B8A4C96|nr:MULTISPECIES: acetate--CoA ligase family protein [Bradyrhizobium]MBR0704703.1 acetate--CoA ligase family protein [Bradyrhizobium diazoefficiens]MBR0773033.1 acetate--CoA ligase family protein [Bradyrhizobium diazoefficiens]MCS3761616.1 acyl-CoA synthetase (NDP forming) [Bradyrhizobium centrosematis]MCS3774284.1 acyl-CoA synthetase (NDP forming) [Bradyrhizobium centrosematis]